MLFIPDCLRPFTIKRKALANFSSWFISSSVLVLYFMNKSLDNLKRISSVISSALGFSKKASTFSLEEKILYWIASSTNIAKSPLVSAFSSATKGAMSPPFLAYKLSWSIKTSLSRRSEEHTSELQSRENLVCRLLLEKKNIESSFH